MTSRTVHVQIDDRARLMSAALAATTWPDTEQIRHRHRPHVHARHTIRRMGEVAGHPALVVLQELLDGGISLERLYTFALNLAWPGCAVDGGFAWAPDGWAAQLHELYLAADLAAWWAEEDAAWARAVEQTQTVVEGADFASFFEPFIGPLTDSLVVVPNICFPSDTEVGFSLPGKLICITPPRSAWGDNEPWPFDDDPAYLLRGLALAYGRLLMRAYLRQHVAAHPSATATALPVDPDFSDRYPTWADQCTELFARGAAALFLETLDPREAQSYLLLESRVHGASILPGVVRVLNRYLDAYQEGRYTQFADYLPNFARHLRAARGMLAR